MLQIKQISTQRKAQGNRAGGCGGGGRGWQFASSETETGRPSSRLSPYSIGFNSRLTNLGSGMQDNLLCNATKRN